MRPGRRSFLIACLSVLGGAALGAWWLVRSTPKLAASECLALLLPSSPSVIRVGNWYLRSAVRSERVELRALAGREFRDVGECSDFLRARIRSEYERGATREVDGFIVAETELRLYALASARKPTATPQPASPARTGR